MDILWASLGICVIVGFVFYIFLKYWQNILAAHAQALRRLSERVHALEEVENPEFRQRIAWASPLPLMRVSTFLLQLSEKFWQETIQATPPELAFVKKYGSYLGSVKIEQWRSHAVVTVYEALARSRSSEWRIRSIDVYPAEAPAGDAPVTLWELPLGMCMQGSLELPPSLELRMEGRRLQFCALHGRFDSEPDETGKVVPKPENVFLDLPLDPAQLGEFRKPFDPDDPNALLDPRGRLSGILFEQNDEQRGIEWRLSIRELQRGRSEAALRAMRIVTGKGAT